MDPVAAEAATLGRGQLDLAERFVVAGPDAAHAVEAGTEVQAARGEQLVVRTGVDLVRAPVPDGVERDGRGGDRPWPMRAEACRSSGRHRRRWLKIRTSRRRHDRLQLAGRSSSATNASWITTSSSTGVPSTASAAASAVSRNPVAGRIARVKTRWSSRKVSSSTAMEPRTWPWREASAAGGRARGGRHCPRAVTGGAAHPVALALERVRRQAQDAPARRLDAAASRRRRRRRTAPPGWT